MSMNVFVNVFVNVIIVGVKVCKYVNFASVVFQASRVSDASNLSQPSSLSSNDGPASLPATNPAATATTSICNPTTNSNTNTNSSTWPTVPNKHDNSGSAAVASAVSDLQHLDVSDRPHTISSGEPAPHDIVR